MADHVSTADDAGSGGRAVLIDRLIAHFRLVEVAEAAAARNGVPDRGEAVAYCLVAITIKHAPRRDRVRLYETPLESRAFPDRLADWADDVARHMRRWEETYTSIQREFDACEFKTLARLVKRHCKDDVIAMVVLDIARILSIGPAIEQMTLAELRVREPAGGAYMFQSPLNAWIATIRGRALQRAEGPPGDPPRNPGEGPDSAALFRLLKKQIAQLRKTREELADAIEQAGEVDMEALRAGGLEGDAASELIGLRAELASVAHELTKERLALPGMLAYVLLALRVSRQRQHVAILSLRAEHLDRDVIDALASRMRAVLADPTHPRPALVRKTREAAVGRPVPRNRVDALEALTTSPERREQLLTAVEADLESFPPAIADTAAIALFMRSERHIVAEQRRAAGKEIDRVDKWSGRAYRRYALERLR